MKKLQKLIASAALVTMMFASAPSFADDYSYEGGNAYSDSSNSSYMSAALPIAVLVGAGILIAVTSRHHGGHSGSGGSSSSSSHAHSHFSSSTSGSSSSSSF